MGEQPWSSERETLRFMRKIHASEGCPARVSQLLNASDVLLGDCLQLQIIATVNCPLENLDSGSHARAG
jgi:hypothetical protein